MTPAPSPSVVVAVRAGDPPSLPGARLVVPDAPKRDVRAVAVLPDGDAARAALADLDGDAWLVDTYLEWDERPARDGDGAAPGVVRFTFLHRLPVVDREGFRDRWVRGHTPIARRHHPALWRYLQHVVREPLTPGAERFDGIAELAMPTAEDFRSGMYDSEHGRAVVADDVAGFLDLTRGWNLLGTDRSLGAAPPT